MKLLIERIYPATTIFYLVDENNGKRTFIGYDGKRLISQPEEDPNTVKEFLPLLVIPMHLEKFIINAFIQAGADLNMRTENENLLQGKVQAIEFHLKDMQSFANKLLDHTLTK
jgi:hypothetical protein